MKRTVTPLYRMRPRQRSQAVRECEQLAAELCRVVGLPPLQLELVSTALPLDRAQECVLGYYLNVTGKAHVFWDRCSLDGDYTVQNTIVHEFGHHVQHRISIPAWYRAEEAGERPPTEYAESSRSEDVSESLMLFASDSARLERVAPVRYALLVEHQQLAPLRDCVKGGT